MNITVNNILKAKSLIAYLVGVVTFIVFIPALQNEFINWDDDLYVYENPFIRSLDTRLLKAAFLGFHASNWHPLTWISHAMDYSVWGLNPLGHHLTNNIVHALNTAIVVFLVMQLMEVFKKTKENNGLSQSFLNDRMIGITGAVTGLLFGLHPLHVESVAWVAERKDLLCAFFFLLSLLTYRGYVSTASGPGLPFFKRQYLLTLGFYILALLSKPMAVTLPVVLLILDWYPYRRIESAKSFWTAFIEKLPFFALSIISSILTILAQKAGGAMEIMQFVPLSTRLLVGSHSLIDYLGKMMVPLNLVPYYPYPKNISPSSLEYIVPFVLVAGITAACLSVMGKQKLWLTAWGYYLITLLPVLGIIQVGKQAMADRYTYLPSLGPFFIIGVIVARIYEKATAQTQRKMILSSATFFIALALLISISSAAIRQIGLWKESTIFWSYVIEKEPERVSVAHNNLGNAYLKKGLSDKAIEQYQIALRLNPDYVLAHNNLGNAYLKKDLSDKAIEQYQISLGLEPDYEAAHYNLGNAYFKEGLHDKAIEQYQIALRLKPAYVEAHNNLGNAYASKGLWDKAIEQYQITLRLKPDLAATRFNLGLTYLNTGAIDKARTEFELVLKLNPDDDRARQVLNSLTSR